MTYRVTKAPSTLSYHEVAGLVDGQESLNGLLAEQLAYYRALAPEYAQAAIRDLPTGDLARARDAVLAEFEKFRPDGDVLELACGPGTWTPELLRHANSVTAVDGAPEHELRNLGWDIQVRYLVDPFYWGSGMARG